MAHYTCLPACPPACPPVSRSAKQKAEVFVSMWGIVSVPKIKFEWSKFSSKLRNGIWFFHQYNDPYMLLLFYEWNSQRSSYICVSAFVCVYERQVQKVPIMWQSAKWSILQICVYTCVRVCVFEVPQRYQILADMPNWTYCRLGRWREPKRSFGNNVPPSPPEDG